MKTSKTEISVYCWLACGHFKNVRIEVHHLGEKLKNVKISLDGSYTIEHDDLFCEVCCYQNWAGTILAGEYHANSQERS